MRLLLLLLAIGLVVSRGRGSVQARHRHGRVLGCAACETLLLSVDALLNTTNLNALASSLDAACREHFGNKTVAQIECFVVATGLAQALEEIPPSLSAGGNYPLRVVCGLAGLCELRCCSDSLQPEQLHITLGATADTMHATWITYLNTSSVVEWDGGNTANGTTSTYKRGGWNGTVHHATMTALQPGQRYTYRVGDGTHWSPTSSFRTPSHRYPLRLGVIADMGAGTASVPTIKALAQLVDSDAIDVLFLGGDNGYSDGNDEIDDEVRFPVFCAPLALNCIAQYGRQISPLVSRVPFVTIPGNHEIFANFTAYRHRYPMANRPQPDALYWATSVGRVRFIGLNSESLQNTPLVSTAQLSWLQTELQQSSARKASGQLDWIVVFVHRPLYCTSQDEQCGKFAGYMREKLEWLFYNATVDLVHQGHQHNYQRTAPVFQGSVMGPGKAPVYVVNGMAGSREGDSFGFEQPRPPWLVKALTGASTQQPLFGFSVVTINATCLHMVAVADSVDQQGEIVDEFWLLKE